MAVRRVCVPRKVVGQFDVEAAFAAIWRDKLAAPASN